MTKYGILLVFKEGVSKDEIAKALDGLSGIIDVAGKGRYVTGADRTAKWVPMKKPSEGIEEFDSEHGEPVFYIP